MVAHGSEFADTNDHTGERKSDDKVITVQTVRDVKRPDNAKEGNFRFPPNIHHDEAFNAPEGWNDCWWGRDSNPEPKKASTPATRDTTVRDDLLCIHTSRLDVGNDVITSCETVSGAINHLASSGGQTTTKPAEVMPSGHGLVRYPGNNPMSMNHEDDHSDLESIMSDAEWKTLAEYSNLHEFSFEEWIDELLGGRIQEGPPLDCVVARRFVDMSTGKMLAINNEEQYRVPFAFVDDRVDESKPFLHIELEMKTLL
jgi:hypothetical protein